MISLTFFALIREVLLDHVCKGQWPDVQFWFIKHFPAKFLSKVLQLIMHPILAFLKSLHCCEIGAMELFKTSKQEKLHSEHILGRQDMCTVLKSDFHLPKKILFSSMIALQKWWKMFLSSQKLFSFSRYL